MRRGLLVIMTGSGIEAIRRWCESARKTDTSAANAAKSLAQAVDKMSAADKGTFVDAMLPVVAALAEPKFAELAGAVVDVAGPVLADEVDDMDGAVTDVAATIAAQFVILQAFDAEDEIADILTAINTADTAIGSDVTALDTARDDLVAAAALVPLED